MNVKIWSTYGKELPTIEEIKAESAKVYKPTDGDFERYVKTLSPAYLSKSDRASFQGLSFEQIGLRIWDEIQTFGGKSHLKDKMEEGWRLQVGRDTAEKVKFDERVLARMVAVSQDWARFQLAHSLERLEDAGDVGLEHHGSKIEAFVKLADLRIGELLPAAPKLKEATLAEDIWGLVKIGSKLGISDNLPKVHKDSAGPKKADDSPSEYQKKRAELNKEVEKDFSDTKGISYTVDAKISGDLKGGETFKFNSLETAIKGKVSAELGASLAFKVNGAGGVEISPKIGAKVGIDGSVGIKATDGSTTYSAEVKGRAEARAEVTGKIKFGGGHIKIAAEAEVGFSAGIEAEFGVASKETDSAIFGSAGFETGLKVRVKADVSFKDGVLNIKMKFTVAAALGLSGSIDVKLDTKDQKDLYPWAEELRLASYKELGLKKPDPMEGKRLSPREGHWA